MRTRDKKLRLGQRESEHTNRKEVNIENVAKISLQLKDIRDLEPLLQEQERRNIKVHMKPKKNCRKRKWEEKNINRN